MTVPRAASCLSICLIAALASCAPAPSAGGELTGAWRSSVSFADGPLAPMKDLEFMYSFNAGGTMTESSNYDEVPPVAPAYGIWRRTGERRFEAVYSWYSTNPPAKLDTLLKGDGWNPTGRGVLTETITLSADGDSYTSTISLEMYDRAGKPIPGTNHGTALGRRMKFKGA